ncbi:MAG: hypothetical protein GX811_09120 [Lentisphaerae bacterium]|nr:hypothetical protein [Lentisphaerota bacterium]
MPQRKGNKHAGSTYRKWQNKRETFLCHFIENKHLSYSCRCHGKDNSTYQAECGIVNCIATVQKHNRELREQKAGKCNGNNKKN